MNNKILDEKILDYKKKEENLKMEIPERYSTITILLDSIYIHNYLRIFIKCFYKVLIIYSVNKYFVI